MYSFDVFDTLITRKTAVPEGIFAVMQSELEKEEYVDIPASTRNNFFRLRIEAEKLARYFYQINGIEDVTLGQIYDVFAMRGELSDTQQKQLMRLECDVEYRECVPVEKNVAQLEKLLSNGENVILISDMYLPKEQIYKMLAKAASALAKLHLYVSGDCKKRKYTGAIYKFAMEQSRFAAIECLHTGDNEKTDIDAAEKIGFCSKLSWFPELLPIEKRLLDQTPDNIWLNRVIGCSRRARLVLGEEMAQKNDVLIGTSTGGILLTSYIQWVIRSALARGIKRLYFSASDGYVLKHIADLLIQKTKTAMETYYIRGNEKHDWDLSANEFAFVAMSERGDIQKWISDLFPDSNNGCFPVFLFSLNQLIVSNEYSNFVFYPGRIRKWNIWEQFYTISENRIDYLAGIEKFTDFFCEDGHMIVQFEDIEQISKILIYITEKPDELLTGFL